MVLYGIPIRDKIKNELVQKIKGLKKPPCLAIVQVGDREDSNIYIGKKINFGKEIGASVVFKKLETGGPKDFKEAERNLIEEIKKLNKNKEVDGIVIQLPLPEGFNTQTILDLIDKSKDTDGIASAATPSKVKASKGLVIPATARAVLSLIDYYGIKPEGKKVAVIGQGILAGKPVADELENSGAYVIRCDANTPNIPDISKNCDILVSAVGRPRLITKEYVKPGAVVIDIGIIKDGSKTVGDVCFDEVQNIAGAITPVPGGVGPVTVACLFLNLVDLCYNKMIIKN